MVFPLQNPFCIITFTITKVTPRDMRTIWDSAYYTSSCYFCPRVHPSWAHTCVILFEWLKTVFHCSPWWECSLQGRNKCNPRAPKGFQGTSSLQGGLRRALASGWVVLKFAGASREEPKNVPPSSASSTLYRYDLVQHREPSTACIPLSLRPQSHIGFLPS